MNNKMRLRELDGLKGVLSLILVVFHYCCSFSPGNIQNMPFHGLDCIYVYGGNIVELFFMLSGFLICHNYKERVCNMSLVSFLNAKVKRLFLMFFFANFFECIMYYAFNFSENNYAFDFGHFLSVMSMTSWGWFNLTWVYNSPTWFCCVLFLCYLIWFAISKLSKDTQKRNIYLVLNCVFIVLGWTIIVMDNSNIPFLYTDTGRGYFAFFLGCIIYEIYKNSTLNWSKLSLCNLIIVVIIILGDYINPAGVIGNYNIFFKAFLMPVILIATVSFEPLKKLFSLAGFQVFGKISMSIYFTNQFVMHTISRIDAHWAIGFPYSSEMFFLFVGAVVLVVSVLWHFTIEKGLIPFIVNKTLILFKSEL